VTDVEGLWIVAVGVVTFGAIAVASLARSALSEMKDLKSEVARFGELHVALGRVHSEVSRSRVIVDEIRSR
jgi:hypothetical protein